LTTIHDGQANIGQQQINSCVGPQDRHCVWRIRCFEISESELLHHPCDQYAHRRVILNDQDGFASTARWLDCLDD